MADFVTALARIVDAHPSNVALEDGRTWTYAELWRDARALAGALAAEGIGRGDLVGIRLPKSPETVVSIVATWLAGAAFVPIDPAWPEERVGLVVREARVRRMIDPDARGARADATGAAPHDLAYVVYTSGSTGAPKGVRVSHAGLVPVLQAQIAAFRLAPGKRCLFVLSPAFDASISDVGTALLSGATLVFPDGPPTRVRSQIEEKRVTHVDLPPALLARVAHDPPSCLETVVIGGEVAPPELVRRLAARVRVVNVYGPTEATICTSLCVCDERWSRPLLGEPIAGMRYRVEEGELLIEGPGLALGYVARPELEAARFVTRGGRRAYRTGDRVARHDDGTLEFLGRVDRQVKVRGVLVAPEEVEACLAAHPAVARAAVVVDEGELTAIVAGDLSVAALRDHVAARLPRALWPARFSVMGALPETASGKVDLAAAAREEAFGRIFRASLGKSVGRHDDFFALGGDSFAVLEAVAAAEAAGIALSPEALYRRPTIAELGATPLEPASMRAEALLADTRPALELTRAPRVAGRGAILVTGATGALGRRVVRELGARGVRCLVRRGPGVRGDVTLERFGLDEDAWERLREEISVVYHLAASVHFAQPYERLRATNLLGTARVLAFARGKVLHYASTLSVGACVDPAPACLFERDRLDPNVRVVGGYAQSKWAAEALVERARDGEAWTTYRLGLLSGGQLATFIKGVARLGALPRVEDPARLRFDVTPIDWAARALVALSLLPRRAAVFHLAAPRPASLAELVDAMRARAVRVDFVDPDAFRRRVESLDHETATALLSLCRRALGSPNHGMRDLFLATDTTFDTTETSNALPEMPCPAPDLARCVEEALA